MSHTPFSKHVNTISVTVCLLSELPDATIDKKVPRQRIPSTNMFRLSFGRCHLSCTDGLNVACSLLVSTERSGECMRETRSILYESGLPCLLGQSISTGTLSLKARVHWAYIGPPSVFSNGCCIGQSQPSIGREGTNGVRWPVCKKQLLAIFLAYVSLPFDVYDYVKNGGL